MSAPPGRLAGPLQPPPRPTVPTFAAVSLAACLAISIGLAAAGRRFLPVDLVARRPALATPAALRAALAPSGGMVSREAWEAERAARLLAEARYRESLRTLVEAGAALEGLDTAAAEWITAPAWGVSPSPAARRFHVAAGASEGIRVGAAVVGRIDPRREPVLVGRVVEVHAAGSVAVAVADPASAVPVRVEGHGAGGILLQGAYPRAGARLLYLPRTAAVAPGAEVRTVVGVPDLPAGLLVGTVETVAAGEGEFLEARVRLPVDPGALRVVLIARGAVSVATAEASPTGSSAAPDTPAGTDSAPAAEGRR